MSGTLKKVGDIIKNNLTIKVTLKRGGESMDDHARVRRLNSIYDRHSFIFSLIRSLSLLKL